MRAPLFRNVDEYNNRMENAKKIQIKHTKKNTSNNNQIYNV
jgi:hypothetical protein